MLWAGLLALALVFIFAGNAWASDPPSGCYSPTTFDDTRVYWRNPYDSTSQPFPFDDSSAAANDYVADLQGDTSLNLSVCGINAGSNGTLQTWTVESGPTALSATSHQFVIRRTNNSSGATATCTQNMSGATGTKTKTCPAQPTCTAGFIGLAFGNGATAASVFPANACRGGCIVEYETTGPGIDCNSAGVCGWAANSRTTGETCTGASGPQAALPDPPYPDAIPEGENCRTTAGGLEICEANGAKRNCGYYNDERVCLDDVKKDSCSRTAGGAVVCGKSAPTPPVPDAGTGSEGVKAEPDEVLKNPDGDGGTTPPESGDGGTVNYYNNLTVVNSSRDVPEGSGPSGAGNLGNGDGEGPGEEEGEEGGEGSASGGVACTDPPVCDGDPIQCALLMQAWRQRCEEIPSEADYLDTINATEEETAAEQPLAGEVDVGALDSDGFLAAGACPAGFSISVMGENLEMDIWEPACTMAELFAPVVMALAYLSAAFVLFRGNV